MPHFIKIIFIGLLAAGLGTVMQLLWGEVWRGLDFAWLEPDLLGPATLGLISGVIWFDLLALISEVIPFGS